MKYASSFEDVFTNGYTSESRSLLEAETINSINNNMDDATGTILPPCHLDFGNFGNIEFPWMDIKAAPVNYKLFNKLHQLSNVIRSINDAFISLILEFQCCGIAELYNNSIIPIFEWVLKDFIGVLTDIASGLIQGNQAFKVLVCAVKPVPANPWLGIGGVDYLSTVYSYLNGFEAIYNWIMDGNPVDLILNPVQDFYNKISSCTPINAPVTEVNLELGSERLKELLSSYKNSDKTSPEAITSVQQTFNDFKSYEKDKFVIHRKITDLKNQKIILSYAPEELYAILRTFDIDEELKTLNDEVKQLNTDNAETIKAYNAYQDEEIASTIIESTKLLSSDRLVSKNIDQLLVDKFNPTCSCLTNIIGISAYNLPTYRTIRTWADVDNLSSEVHWGSREIWKTALEKIDDGLSLDTDIVNNIFISRKNIQKLYDDNNSSIDRDNKVTLEVNSYNFGNSISGSDIDYNYIDGNGVREDESFDVSVVSNLPFITWDTQKLYLYSDVYAHSDSDVRTIFDINAERYDEKNRLLKDMAIVTSRKIQIEYRMEEIWNNLRRAAIDKMNFEKFYEATKDTDESFLDLDIFHATSYSTGFESSLDFLSGANMLSKLGAGFDMNKFLLEFQITDFTFDEAETDMENFEFLKIEWIELSKSAGQYDGLITRIDSVIKIDNVVVEIIDQSIQDCGCDILCKLLQWVLDIILSTVNSLIEMIIAKILKMVLNEHVAYIIKVILQYAQCIADIAAFSDNISDIKARASAMNDETSGENAGLNLMKDPAYCDAQATVFNTLDKLLIEDEIHVSHGDANDLDDDDTIIYPDPSFGVIDTDNTPNPGNILINNGTTVKGDIKAGKSIPEVEIICAEDLKPSLTAVLDPVNQYEVLLVFKPSDYINSAPVVEVEQGDIVTPDALDIDGNIINTSEVTSQVQSLSDLLKVAEQQVQEALNAPVYLDTDCEIHATPNTMTLCSTDNLFIESTYIIDDVGEEVVDFDTYGELSANANITVDVKYEYFPEDDNADENGMVQIPENETYRTYTIPDGTITVNPPVVNTWVEIVDIDTPQIDDFSSSTETVIENFETLSTLIELQTSFNLNGDILEKHYEETRTLTVDAPFRFIDLEILVTFKNLVNSLDVRFVLDVLGSGEVSSPSLYDANVRYRNVVDIGFLQSTNGVVYHISDRRLLFLSQTLLKDNSLIKDPRAVAEEAETQKNAGNTELDKCLLPENQQEVVQVQQGITENITAAIDSFNKSTAALIPEVVEIEPIDYNPIQLDTLKYSIPLIVLNQEHNIILQIVDKKIFLQFKSNSLVMSAPLIIDHELVPDDTYMLVFGTNNLMVDLKLITQDKIVHEIRGINSSGVSLLPTIIGGNADGTESFCGATLLDLIFSKGGGLSDDYYNRSVMSYIPRTAAVVFDFSVSQGSRVFNTINKAGAVFIKDQTVLDRFNNPIEVAAQKADYYGDILSNNYYQVLNGYMDNFFCRENLQNKDFTVSLWLNKIDTVESTRHIILADDINQNYIYYDSVANRIILDIYLEEIQFVFIQLTTWTHITFKHNYYSNRFVLDIHELDGASHTLAINSRIQFSLMSIFAEYSYDTKKYINEFGGLLSTVSIFFTDIDSLTYNTLHNEQSILVRGMENLL
jgi:hypothetical protein